MKLKKLIKKINKENVPPGGWKEGDKLTSAQAAGHRNRIHKLRAQAGVQNPQAQGSGSQGTSAQALDPGYKLPG